MEIKLFKSVFSHIKNFKKTEPQLFWVISFCFVLSLSLTTIAIAKLSNIQTKLINESQITKNNNQTVDPNQPRVTGAWEVEPTPTPTNFTKINWFNQPQAVSNSKIFNQSDKFSEDEVSNIYFNKMSTYLVGKFEDGSELIKVVVPSDSLGLEYNQVCRLVKSTNGQFSFLTQEQQNCDLYGYLLPEVSLSDIYIKELSLPESLQVNGIDFELGYFNTKTLNQLTNPKLIGSTEYGNLYVVYTQKKDIDNVYIQSFYLELKDKTLYSYNIKSDILNDDLSSKITWIENNSNTDRFNSKLSFDGCSNRYFGNDIIKDGSSLIQNKIEVGTFGESKIYQIKDINNTLVKRIYDLYKELISYNTDKENLSINDFVNTKNHFLYQDKLGDWVIYINQEYTVTAECGKPVIYLYPQQKTQVKVQVGAKIIQSEPTYPDQGWSVTAEPNGELIYQNQSYPYLFWEGLGDGIYPDYKDRGTLVSQKKLIPTIYNQLSQLGLNQKESTDFMEFWQPRLPKTPYVRLTWLGTQDMNRLAPLIVSPKPDTSIRIFLEFEGLEKPVTLKPQKLAAPTRNGFTLIEWGGLLIKPSK